MASTYSPLKFELIGPGEQVGTWNVTTNKNLGTAIEEAIVGMATVNFAADANLTITLDNTVESQAARHFVLNVVSSTSLTVTRDLIVPTTEKPYIVKNNTTGAQSIRVKTAAGTGITIPNGKTAFVYVDGVNVTQSFGFFTGDIDTTGNVSAGGNGTFGGDGSFTGDGSFGGDLDVGNDLDVIGNADVGGDLDVTGNIDSGGDGVFAGNGAFNGTGQVRLPSGTNAQRSLSPVDGMVRYNTDLDSFEGYGNGAWGGIGGAQAGGAIVTNRSTATVSYTIAAGENGFSVGPLTVASGVTITVDSGQRWLVV